MKQLLRISSFLLFSVIFMSCEKEDTEVAEDPVKDYLFLGHIYKSDALIDDRVANLDLSCYDQIWLGGDVCSETTAERSTLIYLDNLFDLSSTATHWALGNHDIRNGNVQWITEQTQRPTFYTSNFNGITLLVLNTNFDYGGSYDTDMVNAQFEMIENVCDTLSSSSHLIVFSHHAVWDGVDQISDLGNYANGRKSGLVFNFDPVQQYLDGVYPKLQEVQARGIQVIHVAGDFGQEAASYLRTTSDGIQFIGSGITSNTEYNEQFRTAGIPDSIMVFHHDIEQQSITWTFKELN